MRKSTALLLGELESKVSGYVALLNFRYLNLCVNAEPVALLPITVEYDDSKFDIEMVADVMQPRDDQFYVFPKDGDLLFSIGKSIAKAHPEFKQSIWVDKGKDGMVPFEDGDEDSNDADKFICLTMPVVNEDRRDFLMDGVKILFGQCDIKLKMCYEKYTARIVANLLAASKEEIEEAKEKIEEIKKQYDELSNSYREKKESEIEEGYQRYVSQQEAEEQHRQEQQDASNKDVSQGFRMSDMSDDETSEDETSDF